MRKNNVINLLPYSSITDEVVSIFESDYDVRIWDEPSFKDMVQHALNSNGKLALVTYNSEPAGITGFIPFDEAGAGDWETFIYLAPKYRRKGISKTLLHSFAVAGFLTHIKLWSDVRVDNIPSIAAHELLFPGWNLMEFLCLL